MTAPLVSVVVGIYNTERYLRSSLDRILRQDDVPCEFILVDDGSTDASAAMLDKVAQGDGRVRLLRQENQGLTHALIRGCSEARGTFIARHDADDLSLPGRFARQAALLQSDSRLAFVSCWTRTIGPEGEMLFETQRPADPIEATRQLIEEGNGTYPGSVMFRADAYRRVGGYRPAFRYTQDWDLWLRLAEVGLLGYVSEVLFAFRVSESSISAQRRDQQLRLLEAARRCRAARQRGESELPWLDEAAKICREPRALTHTAASNAYFIGKCLLDRRDRRALKYLRRSVRERPWSWRNWAALSAGVLLCRRSSSEPSCVVPS
jgi:glycosyltransferase involved in cell wall biosynthesis